jgi:hypothetical protein
VFAAGVSHNLVWQCLPSSRSALACHLTFTLCVCSLLTVPACSFLSVFVCVSLLQDSRITIDGIIRHPWFSRKLPAK